MAHLIWSQVLRGGEDAAIDATCGNGHDSSFLASLLFRPDTEKTLSELICIDIQQQACEATRKRLEASLNPNIMRNNVKIVHESHSNLPRPSSPVGLVCYNLGYLPKSEDRSTFTQMESTVESIADAALILRVGGMISVMTYPKSNPCEDYAVHGILEGMALLTSRLMDWEDYVNKLGPDPEGPGFTVRNCVRKALNRIKDGGADEQTWRVMEHKTMGRPLSPILLTATRVK
uniref:rRNA methylase n=1 Tax=Cyclophora tenuis TaxID=216820 RepID=A0A7S1D9N7_CYCTE